MATLILGRDGMGADATEADFENWVAYVCAHIDERVGFEVDVEERGARDVQSDHVAGAVDDEEWELVDDAKRALWDEWCAAGAPRADSKCDHGEDPSECLECAETRNDVDSSPASKAYEDGLADGLAWDLDDYDSHEDVERDREGWDEATINAVGSDECRRLWGVPEGDDEAWQVAMSDYNRGAYEGATAPQEKRSGCGPRSMRAWRIVSSAGADLGTYDGETAAEALDAMARAAGYASQADAAAAVGPFDGKVTRVDPDR